MRGTIIHDRGTPVKDRQHIILGINVGDARATVEEVIRRKEFNHLIYIVTYKWNDFSYIGLLCIKDDSYYTNWLAEESKVRHQSCKRRAGMSCCTFARKTGTL